MASSIALAGSASRCSSASSSCRLSISRRQYASAGAPIAGRFCSQSGGSGKPPASRRFTASTMSATFAVMLAASSATGTIAIIAISNDMNRAASQARPPSMRSSLTYRGQVAEHSTAANTTAATKGCRTRKHEIARMTTAAMRA